MIHNFLKYRKARDILSKGGVCVLPTDTIYGIHCQALNKESVDRVYKIKNRDRTKPFIILIPSISSLKAFGISYDVTQLRKYWPGPYSIILTCEDEKYEYLHCGNKSLAFRLPDKNSLVRLMRKTGPLISTSVNLEGETQFSSVLEAEKKFGDQIDLYIDEGTLDNKPSKVIDLQNNIYRE